MNPGDKHDPLRQGLFSRGWDAVLELTGGYRLAALIRGSCIALSATVKTPSRLELSRGSTIQRGVVVHCGGKAWCGYRGHVRLGTGVVIGPYCVIYGAGGIDIDDFVHLGPGVKIMSQAGRHDRKRLSTNPTHNFSQIRVGAGSWIGAGAVVLGGSDIGRCVTVAPNSVVSGEIPDFSVVAGNPSRVILQNEELE